MIGCKQCLRQGKVANFNSIQELDKHLQKDHGITLHREEKRKVERAGLYSQFLEKRVVLTTVAKETLTGTIIKIDSYDLLFETDAGVLLVPKHSVALVSLANKTRKLTIPDSVQK